MGGNSKAIIDDSGLRLHKAKKEGNLGLRELSIAEYSGH